MKLNPGQVLEEFEAGGRKVIFRVIRKGDENGCLAHINSLIAEKAMIAWQKPFTLKREKEWLKEKLKEIAKGDNITVIVESEGRMIGCASVWKDIFDAKAHVAHIAIGLNSQRGQGIGERLMAALERVAKNHLGCSIIELTVYENNAVARGLYEKMGFRETGRVPKGCNHFGKYFDEVIMVKEI